MEPKKTRREKLQKPNVTSTPAGRSVTLHFSGSDIDDAAGSSLEVKNNLASVKPSATFLELIIKAIEFTGVPKKGASFLAIKKWIFDYKEGNNDRMLVHIKKAMLKGIESGIIARTSGTKFCQGLSGSFLLAKNQSKNKVNSTEKEMPKRKKLKPDVSEPVGKAATSLKTKKKVEKRLSDKIIKGKNTAVPSQPKKPVARSRLPVTLMQLNQKLDKKNAMIAVENDSAPVKVRKIKEDLRKIKPVAKPTQKPGENGAGSSATRKTTLRKKLYASNLPEKFRKDLSDSELHEKTIYHRSRKSYSSDTEVETAKKVNTFKTKSGPSIKRKK